MGEEGTDLAIGPAGQDRLTVRHEADSVALKARNLNSEQLLASKGVPDTNVVERAGSKQLGVARGESNVVDLLVVAGVAQLRVDGVTVAPVKSGLASTGEEVGVVSSQSDGGNSTHNLGLVLHNHGSALNLCDGTITSTNNHVTVREELKHVDTLLEELFGWANTFVELTDKVNLDNVTGKSTEVSRGVIGVDLNALELSLDLASVDVVEVHLLGNEVAGPHAHTVVVDGDELVVDVVEELDLVGYIHADGVAADSLAGLDLPDHKVVVVLATQGSQVLLVLREGEGLDVDLVEFKTVHDLECVEVPDDNVRLKLKPIRIQIRLGLPAKADLMESGLPGSRNVSSGRKQCTCRSWRQ